MEENALLRAALEQARNFVAEEVERRGEADAEYELSAVETLAVIDAALG